MFSMDDILMKLEFLAKMAAAAKEPASMSEKENVICSLKTDVREFIETIYTENNELLRINKESGSRITELENELARIESLYNNNSRNSGATSAVDRSSCNTRRCDGQQENSDDDAFGEDGTSGGKKEPQENPSREEGKSVNQYNSRDAMGSTGGNTANRKAGAQKGHRGTTLTMEDVERILRSMEAMGLKPEVIDIGNKFTADYKSRFRIGICMVPFVKEYRYHRGDDGKYHIPAEMNTKVTYDVSAYTHMVYLRDVGNLPCQKVADYIRDATDGMVSPGEGTVCNAQSCLSDSSRESLEALIAEMLDEKALFTDATYTFKNGLNAYIRNVSSTKGVIYVPMDSKSLEALRKIDVLPDYHGILIHDHEVALYHFGEDHGECIIHVMRYCRKNQEDTGNTWLDELIHFFTYTQERKNEYIARNESEFPEEVLSVYRDWYDEIVQLGREQNRKTKYFFAKNMKILS